MTANSESAQLITPSVLEGKALSKPVPSYPWIAQLFEVSGDVRVDVVIDESGNVTAANAISGPRLLRAAAVEAARKARFSPTLLSGRAVKVKGLITYQFKLD
jgi:periplasmic protein TonB